MNTVAATHEVWVTEPGKKVIETFRVSGKTPPTPTQSGTTRCPTGPNRWRSTRATAARTRTRGTTARSRSTSNRAPSSDAGRTAAPGRAGSRWTSSELVFVGCDEGKAVVLDAGHDGHVIGHAPTGDGVDIIAYDAKLSHLYVPGGGAADLTIIGVGNGGAPSVLGKLSTAREAHCVTADDLGNVYVCDPGKGRLLTFRDPFPASR